MFIQLQPVSCINLRSVGMYVGVGHFAKLVSITSLPFTPSSSLSNEVGEMLDEMDDVLIKRWFSMVLLVSINRDPV